MSNSEFFYGRTEEQKRFREALDDVQSRTTSLPYVFLLYGQGGIGKTTLSRRYEQIALTEHSQIQRFRIDWETEAARSDDLQGDRDSVRAFTLFDKIVKRAIRCDRSWEKHFRSYRTALDRRRKLESKAQDIVESDPKLRAAVAEMSAGGVKLASRWIPSVLLNDKLESAAAQLTHAGLESLLDQLHGFRQQFVRKFSQADIDLLSDPENTLADILGESFKVIARRHPLLIVFDTYELVDRRDAYIQQMIESAGPRVVWVLAGRNNLHDRRKFGADTYSTGYSAQQDQDWRAIPYDMRQLARRDVAQCFADVVPERRELEDDEIDRLERVTLGIPLVIRTAAEIWKKTGDLNDIVSVGEIAESQIVETMVDRYNNHCVTPEDERALFAMALADGDFERLKAFLRIVYSDSELKPDDVLARLERDYAAVYRSEHRLHDEPAQFYRVGLRNLRDREWVKTLNRVAIDVLLKRLSKLEEELPQIKDRCDDEDWRETSQSILEHLFWLDESEGWKWLVPRWVEAKAYHPDSCQGFLSFLT